MLTKIKKNNNSPTQKCLHVVTKEDPQAWSVGGRAVHDVHFKPASRFSPLLVCSEHFTEIHLKTARTRAFDNAPYVQQSLYPEVLC